MGGQNRNVVGAFAEWRQLQIDDVQAVVKVLAELIGFDHLFQIAVGRRDDANVHRDRLFPAQAFELSLLQHAQQFHLHGRRQLADLIQKKSATVGQFETALAARVGAGERAFFVAEKLRFDQAFGQRRDVAGEKRGAGARAEAVHGLGQHLLACARFAGDQDGRACDSHRARLVSDAAQRRTRPYYAALPACFAELIAEVEVVLFEQVVVGRATDNDLDFVDVEWLMEKIVSAPLYDFERGLPILVAGDDYNRQQRVEFTRRLEDGQTLGDVRFDGRHTQVAEHYVDRLGFEELQSLPARIRLENAIFIFQRPEKLLSHCLVIVDH